ncbi:unnamed protein product [Ilex paraguariensis]|uniref:Uncharacterized protein n=1 Tax=Ilex paraguariensis TaxID=185542 RepID=A0ABC8QY75_9AQUA
MTNFNCFCAFVGIKKKNKDDKVPSKAIQFNKGLKTLQVRIERPVKSSETHELKSTSFSVPVPFAIPGSSRYKVKVMSHESPVGGEVEEVAYEGGDEHDEKLSMKRENSDSDLQSHVGNSNEENDHSLDKDMIFHNLVDSEMKEQFEENTEKDAEEGLDLLNTGHISDPGIGKAEFWASPKLKRSCSDLETWDMFKKIADQLPLPKSESFEDMQKLAERTRKEVLPPYLGSPVSVMTHCSADRVMLKKHSSSQILPSRSRRLWWKLFLWSHRNLHSSWTVKPQPLPIKPPLNQQGGYSSDTLEPRRGIKLGKLVDPGSFTGESFNKGSSNNDHRKWGDFHGDSGLWPQNQWVAFSAESSTLTRVDEWVKELSNQPPLYVDDEDPMDDGIAFPPSPDAGKLPERSTSLSSRYPTMNVTEEILQANSAIQSLNSSSTVAHISGIGLKVIPTIARFSSLRSINLSGNLIVHITPGSLPKGLHTLNLSRNKISAIEGLRELTRLRVVDLSYNRISRIGQGLSNCTLIKELYLAGNKISDVEGLHRLMKLTIVDLSFNKITTSKALGQLVANYNSLQALNLLGNPIQSNISEDQLRKAVCSLLPKLAYLNKQPINPQKAREVATEAITKAALGNGSRSSRRKAVKRVSQGGSSSLSVHRSSGSVAQRSRHKSRSQSQTHHHSPLKIKS